MRIANDVGQIATTIDIVDFSNIEHDVVLRLISCSLCFHIGLAVGCSTAIFIYIILSAFLEGGRCSVVCFRFSHIHLALLHIDIDIRVAYQHGLIATTIDVANMGRGDDIETWVLLRIATTCEGNTLINRIAIFIRSTILVLVGTIIILLISIDRVRSQIAAKI